MTRATRTLGEKGDGIVCAEAESANFVCVAGAGGYHQNGQLLLLAHLTADRKAVRAGQEQIKAAGQRRLKAACPVRLDGHVIAREGEIIALDGGDIRIVLDDEYVRHVSPPVRGAA